MWLWNDDALRTCALCGLWYLVFWWVGSSTIPTACVGVPLPFTSADVVSGSITDQGSVHAHVTVKVKALVCTVCV